MIGSGVYSASSMLLSLFVINIVGAEEGGMFSIALTLSQMLVYIAYFEMRTYQITDSKNEFKFSEYHMAKIILCVITVSYTHLRIYPESATTLNLSENIRKKEDFEILSTLWPRPIEMCIRDRFNGCVIE